MASRATRARSSASTRSSTGSTTPRANDTRELPKTATNATTNAVTNNEAEPTTAIRPYEPSDAKEVQILMGMEVFEQLPVANRQGASFASLFLPILLKKHLYECLQRHLLFCLWEPYADICFSSFSAHFRKQRICIH